MRLTLLFTLHNETVNDTTFVRPILLIQYRNKKLSYHKGTARRAVLANSR